MELRNFGVFKIETRKQRIGRNPKNPGVDIQIPERSVVKFRAGKELKELLATSNAPVEEPTPAGFVGGVDNDAH